MENNIVKENRYLLNYIEKTLVDQEVLSAEDFQIILIHFRSDISNFILIGKDINCGDFMFQGFL